MYKTASKFSQRFKERNGKDPFKVTKGYAGAPTAAKKLTAAKKFKAGKKKRKAKTPKRYNRPAVATLTTRVEEHPGLRTAIYILLKSKDQPSEIVKEYLAGVTKLSGCVIKPLRKISR